MRCSNCGNELRGDARFCSTCGAPSAPPPAAPAPASYGAPAERPAATFGDAPRQPLSGGPVAPRKKSGCGKILLILLVIGALVAVGLGIAGYYGFRYAEGKLKSSEAYTLAVEALKSDPEVAEKAGEIRETGFPLGAFDEKSDGTGSAVYRMSVTGTKASGHYDVVMTRRDSKWHMRSGKVTLAGGGVINLSAAGAGGETPELPAGVEAPEPPADPAAGKTGAGKVVSAGVLNGKATAKPEPAYPAAARAARASGVVTVQVQVDEKGRVSSAQAVSGHPLLRASAEAAARQARFSPTILSGRPVKVSGIVTYNFAAPPPQQ